MKESAIFVYGYHAVRAALLKASERAQVLMLQQGREDQRAQEIAQLAQTRGVSVQWMGKPALDKKAEGGVHQGFLLQTRPPVYRNSQDLMDLAEHCLSQTLSQNSTPDSVTPISTTRASKRWPCFLVLDGVTDPHNLGACLRTSVAVGVAGVIVGRHGSPALNATVAKVSSGAVFSVPVFQVGNLVRTLTALQEKGYWAVAAALSERSQPLYSLDLSGPLIWVMGAEGQGLKRLMLDTCDYQAMIPMMSDAVGSLNVSVAVGVALYESLRQFQAAHSG